MAALTRGSLAPGVYWRRRLAVLGTVLLLVIGVARMFGGDEEPAATAANVSAPTSPTISAPPSPTTTVGVTPTPTTVPKPTPTPTPTPTLPAPTGRCSDDDIVVEPSVTDAQATKTVVVRLTLRTLATPACTWRASSNTLQLKITSGSDRVWSTIDCPHAIPTGDVVVRRDTDAVVNVGWNSRRSDEDCSSHTAWAMPGYYHVSVAALGGEPQDLQFALSKPRPTPKPTSTPTPTPSSTPTAGAPTTGARQEPQSDPRRTARKKLRYVD